MHNSDKPLPKYFIKFNSPINTIPLPEQFTFPFNYQPHKLCLIAAKELQKNLSKTKSKGKMYGVLVVKSSNDIIGYLAAFSGNNSKESFPNFVPSVFNFSDKESFYRKGEAELDNISVEIKTLENSKQLLEIVNKIKETKERAATELDQLKKELKTSKVERANLRKTHNDSNQKEAVFKELENQSKRQKSILNQQKKFWKLELENVESVYANLQIEITDLKTERKTKSAKLQQQLFSSYNLLNAKQEAKNLLSIFSDYNNTIPPAAAGECAAPKLLQYAFKNELQPIALAEFWWGPSPMSAVRKQGYFYSACQSKCKPVLSHMLKGLHIEQNPLNQVDTTAKIFEKVFEDIHILVINKPFGLLSVPGKTNNDSVYNQVKCAYPNASGPLIVHRLDMATSGLMIIAKTKEAHSVLQKQFAKRTVKKQYVALLKGKLIKDKGTINLPLRVDLDDRPRQLVCETHGKPALTKWKTLSCENGITRIQFIPITGRTHQLRVHAAHKDGLNCAIIGDELYGEKADRLYLHAESIEIQHPESGETLCFTKKAEF